MSSNDRRLHLPEQAIALRGSGKSRSQIKAILGIGNNRLDQAIKAVPPPAGTRRPNAKDGQRQKARTLSTKGMTYKQIAARLDASQKLDFAVGPGPARAGSLRPDHSGRIASASAP
ncbi:MAG TPA: hypothetical protein VLW50_10730 [Streptosporangiaceae bacterium]|nr:hypothetical protein [Streptosporangiaceae bacterium]